MITAIVLGFLGSLHCVGMCGPIVLALPTTNLPTRMEFLLGRTIYNMGRVVTYMVLGAILGGIGKVISFAGFQASFSVVLGAIILIALFFPFNATISFLTDNKLWKNSIGALFRKKSFSALFGIGVFNGLLPCGLVYAALAGAAASGSVVYGAAFMLVFGLGTIPALLAVSFLGDLFKLNRAAVMRKVLPISMFILGLLLVLRGLSLDIPYISPDLRTPAGSEELFIPHCS